MNDTTVDMTADLIDVRDIIARVEELEGEIEGEGCTEACRDMAVELHGLQHTLSLLRGSGGDEQWRGDWYPVMLIRSSHFTQYAREMLEDCGTIPKDLPAWVEIDWEATAANMLYDYSAIILDNTDYYYR